ncbi:MAG: hypothetical protein ACM3SU_12155, partial [Acidobacteriota bacterium]
MRLRRVLLTLAMTTGLPVCAAADDLRDLLTNFLSQGITLAASPVFSHEAHFVAALSQFTAFNQLNQQLANELSSFPLPSSS